MRNKINKDNRGTNYLKLFYWLSIVLIAILLNKGVETFVQAEKFRDITISFPTSVAWYRLVCFVDGYKILQFSLDFLILFLLLLFSVRYIAWSPYKIFSNVEEFGESGDLLVDTYEERVILEINQSSLRDCLFSFVVFTAEFFLAYLAILSYENHSLLLVVLCFLSGVDILFVLLYVSYFNVSNIGRIFTSAFAGLRGNSVNTMTIQDLWRSVSLVNKEYLKYVVPSLLDFAIMLIILFTIQYGNLIPTAGSSHSIISDILVALGLIGSIFLSFIFHIYLKNYYSHIFYILKVANSFERYEGRIPPAYLEKETSFAGRTFVVTPCCYIPTPETEALLNKVKEHINTLSNEQKNGLKILDIGTGCGNLAIALKSEFSDAIITGTDISGRAIGIAHKNASKHNRNVRFVEGDLIKSQQLKEQPDLIIANLPWGDNDPTHILKSNVEVYDYEFNPPISLFPLKGRGLVGTYKSLVEQILEKRWVTTLFFEVGTLSENEVRNEIQDNDKYILEYIRTGSVDDDNAVANPYSIVKMTFHA